MNKTKAKGPRNPRARAIRYRPVRRRQLWFVAVALLLLATLCLVATACASRTPASDAELESQISSVSAVALEGTDILLEEDQAGMRASSVIVYFDLDSSEIRSEFHEPLKRVADRLGNAVGVMLRLEGHADERGTREYNIGLGERRAQAVRRFLLLNGAHDAQLSTVSYGEERPVDMRHAEAAWSRNRRVELVATNQTS